MKLSDPVNPRDAITYDDHYPPITDIYTTHVFDNNKLGGIIRDNDLDNAKFNGCLFEHNSKRLLCYRAYSNSLVGKSNIFITELVGLTPVANHELNLPSYTKNNRQYEDARLFEHKGQLYLSYVAVEYWRPDGKKTYYWSAIHVVSLDDDFNVIRHYKTKFDGNGVDTPQKNWIYFSDGEHLYFIHDAQYHRVVQVDDNLQPVKATASTPIQWPHGVMRGGSNPIRLDDEHWLTWTHASVNHKQRKRRYTMVPYIFTLKEITQIGKPVFASTMNPIVDISATWWHPVVIFPMGVIRNGGNFLLSVGINDLYTTILEIPGNIEIEMEPAAKYHQFKPRYFFWKKATNMTRFSHYKILKVGGMGTEIIGAVGNPVDFAFVNENFQDIEWITRKEYDQYIANSTIGKTSTIRSIL